MLNLNDYGIQMWDEDKIAAFRRTLLAWYDREKRDLPWRRTTDPYKIWVSEIMLQQTQVVTVIPYYERFLEWFPTIADLAAAPEDKLLKAWEGLGYYSRVRNMQAAAQQVMTDFGGRFPNTHESISSLKGIGPYTAGAISSIAFGLPEPAVDGNVMRVLARLFEVDYDIGDPKNRKIFQALMEILIDPDRPGDFNQAFMDLGTDIEHAKTPRPDESPIRAFNAAYLNGTYDRYPIKAPKKKPVPLHLTAFVIRDGKGRYLLEKNTDSGLLSGFWSFPLLSAKPIAEQLDLFTQSTSSQLMTQPDLTSFEKDYGLTPVWCEQTFPAVTHVFSHRKWHVTLVAGQVSSAMSPKNKETAWVHPDDFETYPFATPQKKLWTAYQHEKN
ncbi:MULTISPECIES: A/G-specific adenine glycosylase [unclassified Streptococcus]|uniref:A/G-specific adenine glycosylase n=1 Tax=unclassified Streptococcus TaxID=2608887 RepID=UPI00359D86F0